MMSKLVDALSRLMTKPTVCIKGQGHSLTLVQGHSDSTFYLFIYLVISDYMLDKGLWLYRKWFFCMLTIHYCKSVPYVLMLFSTM